MTRIDPSALLLAGVSIFYPLLAALAVRTIGPGWVVAALCALLLARAVLGIGRKIPASLTLALIGVIAVIGLVALWDQALSVRLYPACMNAAMLVAFAITLAKPPSMIERFARLHEPNLPESGVRYTRRVTWAWVGFFALNGAVAAWTAFYADWPLWTFYNGVVAYVAMGALFLVEFVVRGAVRAKAAS